MKTPRNYRQKRSESGIALLIAIFILLLISALAVSLMVGAGTESSLANNYRSSAKVYYASLAGLEEGRGRLLPSNPNYLNNTVANFIPTAGPLAIGQVRYITNAAAGETVAPATTGNKYFDAEYQQVTGTSITAVTSQTLASVSSVTSGGTTYPGPFYKWVRIMPATEKTLGVDVNASGGALDNTIPLYYDSATSSLVESATPPSTAKQVYQVTSYAVMPNGSQKVLEYAVAPVTYNLNFPSALTLAGSQVNFGGANSNQYYVNGADGSGNPPAVSGCTPTSTTVPAIGTTGAGNVTNIVSGTSGSATYTGIPSNRTDHYLGGGLSTPSVGNTSLNSTLSTPASLDALVQQITANADAVITPPTGTATQTDLPAMSATNPKTIVVDGNFAMTGNFTGYGLLVVTGNFSYSGTTGWAGIILVIGDGTTTFTGSGGGNAEFDGALFAATTRDASGAQLSSLGTVNYDISGGGGNGVYYNSCWINKVQAPPTYKILSFREIAFDE